MNRTLLILFILLFFSCAKIPQEISTAKNLFPFGLYEHAVLISFENGQMLEFSGFNKVSSSEAHFVALSPFGTTLVAYERTLYKKSLYYDPNIIPLSEFQMNIVIQAMEQMYTLKDDICSGERCIYSNYGEEIVMLRDTRGMVTKITYQKMSKIQINVEVLKFSKWP